MTDPADDKTAPRRGRFRIIALAGLAGIAVGVAAIYGIEAGNGNADSSACAAAVNTAEAIKPLARGEVAAFLPTTKAQKVSQLVFDDGDGKTVTVGDFAGKTVLLNLWATWCAPCRKEMPALDTLQQTLGGDDFQVVAVNVDTKGGDHPRKFMKQIGVEHLGHYADDSMGIFNDLRALGRATGLPTTMLVDAKGCEVGTMYGPAEWASDDALALLKAAIGGGKKGS